jgi:phospholipase/lecithinase/hemolysin
MSIKKWLMTSSLIAGVSLWPIPSVAAVFSQIISYGDSLLDLGRAFEQVGSPSYGDMFGGGRYSNGLIWVEYLAPRLGLTTNPDTNFAVGGATTGTANTVDNSLVGLSQQINNNLISDPNALYIVWGGANDYLGAGITDPSIPVGNLSAHITTLINNGAINILVPNLSNLGELPVTIGIPQSSLLNNLTQAHNQGLALAINNLQTTFPNTNIQLLDVNTTFNQIQANPSQFDLTNVIDGCLLVSCTTPDTYFFWDIIHPSTRGHQLISNLAVQTLGVPEPSMVLGLFIVGIGAIWIKKNNV